MSNRKTALAVLSASVFALGACSTPNQSANQQIPVTNTSTTAMTGYGVVHSIEIVPREQVAGGVGLGTVAGAVVGGALGNQVGSGRGRTAATVAGAAGGALAGSAMQRNANQGEVYRVAIQMDNGAIQTMTQETPPGLQVGERVRLSNGVIVERFR